METIESLQTAYREKKLSPVEVTREYLKRISKSRHNAYLEVCEKRALAQAEDAAKRIAGGEMTPVLGIPMGIKDLLTIEGVKTTCASKMLKDYRPPYTATAVNLLEKAGAITLGKLNMDEFAMGSSNENSAFGPCLHPTHKDRVPGGSSGGSASAVGADLCVASLGTDTGGSIRQPAALCGVVGMKPTYGRVSRYGLIAFASSLDQIGPLSRTVADSAAVLTVMSGHDPMDSASAPVEREDFFKAARTPARWKGIRVGIPREFFSDGLDEGVASQVRLACEWMKSEGAEHVEISLPHSKYAVATYYVVAVSEASSNLARYDGVHFGSRPAGAGETPDSAAFYRLVRSGFGPEVKRRIMLGTFARSKSSPQWWTF